ncbi:heme-binding protein [Streptomyces sp. ITFR-6]|uniref:GlcG/HbpS family heme-binding protein n=1 Tax=Streptomyces sp. ITFR-6 TaxID=3075197 RepID=UPI0028891152|nr:heme-binding protein [Streptomyces sp. ITFR-6]WNI34493.1 heme-binding protein [Streptomyces sp. ITFR-6]
MRSTHTVGLSDARRIIDAGIAEADRIGSPSDIAVADSGGSLVTHVRMDGAQLGSIEHSIDKAHTSVLFRSATGDPARDSEPGGQFWGMALSGQGQGQGQGHPKIGVWNKPDTSTGRLNHHGGTDSYHRSGQRLR